MHAGTVSRRRTRSQWDEYYRNWHNEVKGKGKGRTEGCGIGEGDEGNKNVVDSESAVVDDNVASVDVSVLRGKKRNKDDCDVDVIYLGKEIVSDGSSLKIPLESRSLSGSNVDSPVGCHMSHDSAAVSSDDSTNSGNSTTDTNESDDLSPSESELMSEEEDDFSDDDYEANEPSTSDDCEDSYYDEQETETDSPMKGEVMSSKVIDGKKAFCAQRKSQGMNEKKESNAKQDEDGETDEGCDRDEKVELPSVFQITKNSGEREIYVEQDSDEGYHGAHDNSGHKNTRAYEENENVVIISKDEFHGFGKNDRVDLKKEVKLAGLRIIDEPYSNNGCVDEASKGGDSTDLSRIHVASKKVKDNVSERGLKSRKVLGLENADGSNDKGYINWASRLHHSAVFKFQRNESELGNFGSPVSESCKFATSSGHQSKLRDRDSCHIEWEKYANKILKLDRNNTRRGKTSDLINILVESMHSLKEEQCLIEENYLTQETLPLRFRFEDELQPPPAKSEWEKEMDLLFCDLELGLRESEIDSTSFAVTENDDHDSLGPDESPAALCCRGEHQSIFDEEIGIMCKYCNAVILDIKYVLPDFHTPTPGRRDRMNFDKSPDSIIGQAWYQYYARGNPDSINCDKGTVWDLIAGAKKEMYPHQQQGFEFMWKNLAGDIRIEKLKQPLSDEGRGCIISHAPGTGKTRLTIMFLLTFLKLYPTCRPVILAPRGILLTWEAEFIKWHVNIPFHNLNKTELSGDENAVAANIMGQVGSLAMSKDNIRLLKLCSWMRGRSILGMSYRLFCKLVGDNGKGQIQQIRNILLELPGLLVLDEGHTPRNNESGLWNALMEVVTRRRVILSGTPFQNNLSELYNTLCLVNPKFVNQIGSKYDTGGCKTLRKKSNVARKRWTELIRSIGKNKDDRLMKVKRMLKPFIHVHKGNILDERLPGLSESLVFLHPTELQKTLLEIASKADIFHRVPLVSRISVHPSLMAKMGEFFSMHESELEETESDIDAGVKTKFVMHLIHLADALGERVLVFSQFIDPLVFIKKQIISRFSWLEGREVLYMDGKYEEKQRQESILSFNDDKSEAKVLLASERACSEGISLVGASRVVLLDTVWNPSVEKQAISRAYRLGQNKVVYVYRLFTSGTEVRQYAQQVQKERISQLIVGETCHDRLSVVPKDKVLEAMLDLETFRHSFERIIHRPTESDLIEIFGLMDHE